MASAVAFQRGLFPVEAFRDRNYVGFPLFHLEAATKLLIIFFSRSVV